MTDNNQEIPWEGRRIDASADFALLCRELSESDPYRDTKHWEPALVQIKTDLVTELWDQGFSQTEIDSALKIAMNRLPRYTAGEDKRS